MQRIIPFFLLLFLFACASNNKRSTDHISRVNEYLRLQEKYFHFNGNVLIAEKGKIIFQKSYGLADFNSRRPLNDSTVFDIASISKQFTATAILQLLDKQKLKLTDTLRYYFPELPYHNITIHQMLTHTSGLPSVLDEIKKSWDLKKPASNSSIIALFAKEKPSLYFEPGSRWDYSNTGYNFLGAIVEKVSGLPFKDYLAEYIFKPLGMRHTRINETDRSMRDTLPNFAPGFVFDEDKNKYTLPDSLSHFNYLNVTDRLFGAGGMFSTTGDLLKWDRAVKNHTLLSESSQREMLKEQSLQDTVRKYYYGYGVDIFKNELGSLISHSGGWAGNFTNLERIVETDQTFIVFSNNYSNSTMISRAIEYILAGKEIDMPHQHKEIVVDSSTIDHFAGARYMGVSEMKLERRGKKLYRVMDAFPPVELKFESPTKLFYGNDRMDVQFEFELDASKNIGKAWMIANGVKMEMIKLD